MGKREDPDEQRGTVDKIPQIRDGLPERQPGKVPILPEPIPVYIDRCLHDFRLPFGARCSCPLVKAGLSSYNYYEPT